MRVSMRNEYNHLDYCLVAYPSNLQIMGNQQPYQGVIDQNIASTQYNHLINTLITEGVQLHFLSLMNSRSQVFTRDIGFMVEDILFISNMTEPIRQQEIHRLIEFAQKYDIQTYRMQSKVEGGDVILHNDTIFIGQGERTTAEAAEEIRRVLGNYYPNYEVIQVLFDTSKVHLDCVFNILDQDSCIISPAVFNPEDVVKNFSRVIEINQNQVDRLAPNIIGLGNKRILCSNKELSETLSQYGYQSIFIEFSEIIKASGSLGCCILPIYRSRK